jgi:flagellar hook-associated protein 3 FlgL
MRVTENTNYDTVRESIRRSKERMEGLQFQSATTKKINQPSDDPIAAAKLLELRTDRVNNEQFQMNVRIAEGFLSNTDHALADLAEIVLRAKEIAINQSSAPSSSEDSRQGVSEEVTQLYQQAVATANRRVGERFIFGGYQTRRPPIEADGTYVGDDGKMMVEIGHDVFVSINVPGLEAFNSHPQELKKEQSPYGLPQEDSENLENVNLFDELQNFRIGLMTGDLEAIRNTLERFDLIHSKLIATRSKVGSRLQGIHASSQSIERHNITQALLSSSLEDADMAQVVSDLGKEESIFRSSLASAKRLVQPTLLDFLK